MYVMAIDGSVEHTVVRSFEPQHLDGMDSGWAAHLVCE